MSSFAFIINPQNQRKSFLCWHSYPSRNTLSYLKWILFAPHVCISLQHKNYPEEGPFCRGKCIYTASKNPQFLSRSGVSSEVAKQLLINTTEKYKSKTLLWSVFWETWFWELHPLLQCKCLLSNSLSGFGSHELSSLPCQHLKKLFFYTGQSEKRLALASSTLVMRLIRQEIGGDN